MLRMLLGRQLDRSPDPTEVSTLIDVLVALVTPVPLCLPQAAAQAGGKISDAASRQAVPMPASLHLLV